MPSKEATIKWKKENPEKVRALHRKHHLTPGAKYTQLKAKAKYYGLLLNLSKEDYLKLISSSCTYCGGMLSLTGYSIDRIDNTIGYITGNVTPCCSLCNRRKGMLEGAGFKYPRTVELLRELLAEQEGILVGASN